MHAKSVEKITLTAEERETHALKSSYFDEAKTQLKCEWVDRKSDGKGEGRVLWYFASGGIQHDGYAEEGVAARTWRTFREDGTLAMMEERPGDGSMVRSFWENGLKVREGALRKDGAGNLQSDGLWVTYEKGEAIREELYRLGTHLGQRAPLAKLRPLLEAGDVSRALEGLSQNNPDMLFMGVEGLLAEGFALRPEVALDVAMRAWRYSLPRALPLIIPHAAALLPALEAKGDALIAANFREEGSSSEEVVTRVALFLSHAHHTAHPERSLDARFDELLVSALSSNAKSSHNLPLAKLLTEGLAGIPLERMERIVLQLPSRNAWAHNTLLWGYAALAPTPKVLEVALKAIAAFSKAEFKYDGQRKLSAEDTLRACGNDAVPAFIAWLEGDGKKAAQRGVVVEALAKTLDPRGVATLLAFADDTLDDAKTAAREGLAALGEQARPALEAAANGKKGKLKTLAETLLAAMPKEGEAPAAAVVEASLPASLVAYRALQASIESERENYRALVIGKGQNEVRATFEELTKKDAARALAGFAEFALENARSMGGPVTFDMFTGTLLWRLDAHEGLPALLAELLYALPEKGSWNPKYIVKDKLTQKTVAALDTLGFLFEQKLPDAAKHFAVHLAEHHPWEGRRALLALAQSGSKPVRTEAVGGLVRCGTRIVPEVLPLLLRGEEAVLSAAEILRALPDAAAVAPLEAAIAKEKNKKRREALEEALAASKTAGGGAVDLATLDADLSRRAEKRKSVPVVPMPPLHWKNADGSQGAALSEGAAKWFLGALSDEDGGEPNAELMLVRKHLVDADAAALLDAIRSAIRFDHKLKWRATYVFGILGDDKTLALFGAQFQDWASSGAHVLATHGIETLRRNGSGRAIAWLDHWAEEGTGKLQKEAKAALDRTCQERSLDRDGLVDLTTPREAEDVAKAIGEIQRRLEAAMIVGRTFAEAHFQTFVMEHPLVRQAATGLVFQDAERACAILTSTGFVDAAGKATKPAFPVTIPHPCMLADDVIAAFQDALAQQDIAQPFAQLARPFTRDPESALTALRDQKMATRRMIASIEKHGYKRGGVEDAGIVYSAYRTLAAGWILEASHDGFAVANNRNPNGKESVLRGVSARQRDRYDLRPTAAMQSEALEDLKKLLAD
jgi:HEAT repeat protein